MVRAAVVTRRGGRKAVWNGCVALAALALIVPLRGQKAPPRSGDDQALQTLLDRAPSIEAGTYRVSPSGVEPVTAKSAELPVVVQGDVLRGANGQIRVLAAIGADASQGVLVRMRVIQKGANARLVADATGAGGPGPVRLVHEFTLAPGDYELQAVVGHAAGGGATVAALARSVLTVPDVWHGGLAVTPVVLADEAAPASEAPRGPAGRPRFLFGSTALSPAASDRFSRSGAMNLGFRVYNWTAEKDEKLDLTVEYVFYQQLAKHLAFFNKIKAQHLAADTLGEAFDPARGVVATGMMVPLHAFPFGEFEVRVRVTDNRARRTVERRATFKVAP